MIAIVMPCWNLCEVTRDAVGSILENSEGHEIQFIFINNGSTDDTADYLRSVPDAIVITNEENRYICPALNQGFEVALNLRREPEVYGFIANDVMVGYRFLDQVVEVVGRSSELRTYVGNHIEVSGVFSPVFSLPPDFRDLFYGHSREVVCRGGGQIVYGNALPILGYTSCLFWDRSGVEVWYPFPDGLLCTAVAWFEFVFVAFLASELAMLSNCLVFHRGALSLLSLPDKDLDWGKVSRDSAVGFNWDNRKRFLDRYLPGGDRYGQLPGGMRELDIELFGASEWRYEYYIPKQWIMDAICLYRGEAE